MFTGLVTHQGRLASAETQGAERYLRIDCADLNLSIGASIALDGACTTVTEQSETGFQVTVSAESLAKTTLGDWQVGRAVNLELPLRLGDRLDGHLVSGHVDGVAQLVDRRREGASWRLRFAAPAPLSRFIAVKGSVTLNGVSLTVNAVEADQFDVNLIPHTLEVTNLDGVALGGGVNLEVDLFARTIARLMESSA